MMISRLGMRALTMLASLKLTVFLFVCSMVLVFAGTLAQVNDSIVNVIDAYFWSTTVWIPASVFVEFTKVFYDGLGADWQLPSWAGFYFPGGWLLGCVMLANLVAAHLVRFRAVQTYREIQKGFAEGVGPQTLFMVMLRRGGTWSIHLGLILLFVGEYGTRVGQVEQRMTIPEGAAVNYTQDARFTELAFTTPADATTHRVAVVPEKLLRAAAVGQSRISHPDLPYDVGVEVWYRNGDALTTQTTEGVTHGLGLEYKLVEAATATGVTIEQKIDTPGGVVTLYEKGTDNRVATMMVSSLFSPEPGQRVPDSESRVALRFQRHFKPFAIELIKFRKENYPGTDKPKHYESRVRVIDPGRNQDFDTLISMNEPLRHRGEAFFQSSFRLAGPDLPVDETVLQVVKNPVWWIPYLACLVVTLGMVLHFGYYLVQFLVRIAQGRPAGGKPTPEALAPQLLAAGESKRARLDLLRAPRPGLTAMAVTGGLVLLACLSYYGGYVKRQSAKSTLDLTELARLPMLETGRIKPMDTPVRVWMRYLAYSEEVKDQEGKPRPALEWAMELASRPPGSTESTWAHKAQVFRIEDPDVRAMLELERREGFRYSFNELAGKTSKGEDRPKLLRDAAVKASEVPFAQQNLVQKATIQLQRHLLIAQRIEVGDAFAVLPPLEENSEELRTHYSVLQPVYARGDQIKKSSLFQFFADRFPEAKSGEEILSAVQSLPRVEQQQLVEAATDHALRQVNRAMDEAVEADPAARAWGRVLSAYRAKDQVKFDQAVEEFAALQHDSITPEHLKKSEIESRLNKLSPFFHVIAGCVFAMVLLLASWALLFVSPAASEAIRRNATWLIVALLLVQTVTLILRMYLSDRPLVFVTNLYSSAVFIGWGAMVVGLFVERVYPLGIGAFTAAALGFVGNIIAHNLAFDGKDVIEMQEAVLNSNFWLSTHVTTVTAGYMATFVAGLIGIVYVVLDLTGVISRQLGGSYEPLKRATVMGRGTGARELEAGRAIGMLLYGVVCFATLLSFVGTVLGGIWADQSWGRFWGWDPKENGAVLIVIWNALILHARWGGMAKDRTIALLAIAGNMITAFSWFGTNQLGVGLHAYGFNKDLASGCVMLWHSHLALIGSALGVYALDRVLGTPKA